MEPALSSTKSALSIHKRTEQQDLTSKSEKAMDLRPISVQPLQQQEPTSKSEGAREGWPISVQPLQQEEAHSKSETTMISEPSPTLPTHQSNPISVGQIKALLKNQEGYMKLNALIAIFHPWMKTPHDIESFVDCISDNFNVIYHSADRDSVYVHLSTEKS